MKKIFIPLLLVFSILLVSCSDENTDLPMPKGAMGSPADLGGDDTSFGESLEDLGAYDGVTSDGAQSITVTCLSGTANVWSLDGGVLFFGAISEDSVYSVSGELDGAVVIDVGDDYKFELELHGFSLSSKTRNPITVKSGDEVSIVAKKDCENYIYDNREAIDETDEALYSGAIHSEVDLEIKGKGTLTVISENNNGIHSKDDLEVKNLTLLVSAVDNALKGNDSVTVESGKTVLISRKGDGIKTSASDVSEKGNQRGTVSISGGEHTIYAAADGIDAAYNVNVDGDGTVLNIYTDKYSNYSEEITDTAEDVYYIRFPSDAYSYSVKYYNSDNDYTWVDATYHSKASGGMSSYYYYSFPKLSEYSKLQFFIYSDGMQTSSEDEYAAASDLMTPSTSYDTIAISSSYYTWTNYTTAVTGGFGGMSGMGGMNEGNPDKSDRSTKGIKAANEITILAGVVNIKSYDDALHANADKTLENSMAPSGAVSIYGGNVTLYSNDDGIHADGILTLSGGTVTVTHSYEGAEGTTVNVTDGYLSIVSSDDGINSTATSGTGVRISGGIVYIYAGGDGIDSNSRTSYSGIVFEGGRTAVISTSGGNSAIDTEAGYAYTGGYVLALMPRGGMSSEAVHCSNFSDIGTSKSVSASAIKVVIDGNDVVSVSLPTSMSATVIFLGSDSADISTVGSVSGADSNGVLWY